MYFVILLVMWPLIAFPYTAQRKNFTEKEGRHFPIRIENNKLAGIKNIKGTNLREYVYDLKALEQLEEDKINYHLVKLCKGKSFLPVGAWGKFVETKRSKKEHKDEVTYFIKIKERVLCDKDSKNEKERLEYYRKKAGIKDANDLLKERQVERELKRIMIQLKNYTQDKENLKALEKQLRKKLMEET